MFISELFPIFRELTQQPIAFTSGFVAGMLRLNLSEEPLKTWLQGQGIDPSNHNGSNNKGNSNSPQTISIE